jgi:hypothetical protein
MTDERDTIWKVADRLQMNLRACQAQLVELRSYLAAMNIEPGWQPPRAGSPRELHPDACPHCELAAGHTADCPTLNPLEPLDIGVTK